MMGRQNVGMLAALVAGLLVGVAPLAAQEGSEREIVGSWRGSLVVPGGVTLRLVFDVQRDSAGTLATTLDSPDQGTTDIPVSETVVAGDSVKFVLATIGASFDGEWSRDSAQIDGLWRQGGASLPLVLKPGTVEPPARPQEPEPPFPYDVEDVRFPNHEAGIELAGTLTLPRSPGPHPVAVLITGSGPQDRDEQLMGHRPFLVLADHLTRQGIAVLRYDDRGVGESTGEFAGATSEDFATDVQAAVAYLSGREEIDAQRIGLIGHSEGGLIAPIVAARSSDVAFVVLLAGTGVPGAEVLLRQGELLLRANGASERLIRMNGNTQRALFAIMLEEVDTAAAAERIRKLMRAAIDSLTAEERIRLGYGDPDAQIEQAVRRLTSPWFRFFVRYDPRLNLERVTVPVLAINGEKDLQVWHEQNLPVIEDALRNGGNDDVTVQTLPGLNHLFQSANTGAMSEYASIEETFAPAALEAISEWILERFGPTANTSG